MHGPMNVKKDVEFFVLLRKMYMKKTSRNIQKK